MAQHTLTCYTDQFSQQQHDPLCPQNSDYCPLLGGIGVIEVAGTLPEDNTHVHDTLYSKLDHNHDTTYAAKTHVHMYGDIAGLYTHHHKTNAYTKTELKNILESLGSTFNHTLKCYKPMGTLSYPNQWVHDEFCTGNTDVDCPINPTTPGKGWKVVTITPNVYTKAQVDTKLASVSGGSGGVDMTNYYTVAQADEKFVDDATLRANYYDVAQVDMMVQSSYVNISTALRDRVKNMLNLELTVTRFDALVDECISLSAGLISRYLGVDSVPSELEFILVECAIVRYSRIGSEGLTREGIDGYSMDFIVDILSPYHTYLDDYVGRNAEVCNSFKVLRTL